jgi:hypothetical protein
MTRHRIAEPGLTALPTLQIDGAAGYERLKDRIRILVAARVPPGRTLVVSKGDDELLALHDRRGEHFPQDRAGRHPAAHPPSGGDARRQLETLVGQGARYLLVPATSFWWFAYYRELTDLLESAGTLVALDQQTCAVVDLRPEPPASASQTPLRSLLDALLPPDAPVSVLGGEARDLGRPISSRARYLVTVPPAHLAPDAPRPGTLVTSQKHTGELRDRGGP